MLADMCVCVCCIRKKVSCPCKAYLEKCFCACARLLGGSVEVSILLSLRRIVGLSSAGGRWRIFQVLSSTGRARLQFTTGPCIFSTARCVCVCVCVCVCIWKCGVKPSLHRLLVDSGTILGWKSGPKLASKSAKNSDEERKGINSALLLLNGRV